MARQEQQPAAAAGPSGRSSSCEASSSSRRCNSSRNSSISDPRRHRRRRQRASGLLASSSAVAAVVAALLLFWGRSSSSSFASAAAGADSPPPPPGPNSPSAPPSSCAVSEWPPFSSLPASSEGGPRTTLNLELLLTGPSLCPFCAKPQAAVISVVSNTVQTVPHAIEMRSVGQVAVKLAPGASVAPPAVTLADLALIDVPVEVPRTGASSKSGGGGGKKPSGRRRRRRRLQSASSELLPVALNSSPNRRRELFAAGPPPPASASPAPAPSPSSSLSGVAPGCDVPAGYVYTVSGAQHVTVNLTLTLAASSVTSASQMLQSAADGGAMISGFAQSGLVVEKVQILLLRDLAAGGAAADVMLGTPIVQMPQLPQPLAPLANSTAAGGARPGEVGVQPGAIAGILAAAVAGTATAVAVVYKLSTRKRGGRSRRGGKHGGGGSGGANASGASDLDDDELDIEAVKAGIGLPPSMGKSGASGGGNGGGNNMQQSSSSLLDRDPALRLLNSRAAAAAAAAAANGSSDDSALLHGASTDDSAIALRGGMGASGSLSDLGNNNNSSSTTALASADGRAGSGAMHALWQVNWRDLEIVRQIGEGSFGKVYLAKWRETTVAVKVLLSASLPNEQEDGGNGNGDNDSSDGNANNPLLAGLQKEASMMAAMRHPNVVMYLGVCADPPLVVTEYCARGSLCDVLKRARSAAMNAAAAAAASPGGNGSNAAAVAAAAAAASALDWPRRLAMALDAAKGMNYLHSSDPPVIHRDLKSPNLLVDKHWRVKVCDFNLSRVLEEQAVVSSLAASNPRWLAPEILSGRGYTFSSDVYSFGVIMWELLTWRLPWTDCGPWQVVKLVTDDRARPPLPTLDADGNAVFGGGTTAPQQQQQQPNSSNSTSNGHQLLPPPGGFPGLPEYIALMKDCWQHDAEKRPKFAEIITRLRKLLLHETRRAAAAARRGGSGGSDDGANASGGGGGGDSSANLPAQAAAAAAAGE